MRKRTLAFVKAAIIRRPMASIICMAAVLILTGIQIHDRYGPPSATDWNARNLEKIRLADPSNFCFAVFGDNKNSHHTFEGLLDTVDADPEIAFSIVIGDTVYDGEKEKFRYFLGQVKKHLHKPLLTVIGNHETQDHGRGLYAEIFGPFYYAFEFGNTLFIVLDDANEKGLDLWQRNWLEEKLQAAKEKDRQTLVFFHVPLFDPRGGRHQHCLSDVKAAEDLRELFHEYGVEQIFCSHIHAYFEGQWDGVPYIVSGGAGAELAGGLDPAHYFYHYLKVCVTNGTLSVEVHRLPTPDNEWLDRMGSLAWLYLYAFICIHGVEAALALIIGYLLLIIFKTPDSGKEAGGAPRDEEREAS